MLEVIESWLFFSANWGSSVDSIDASCRTPSLGFPPNLTQKIGKLSEQYLEIRNQQMRAKNLTAEMVLAERRGKLIEKRLVEAQAAYLLVALRQRILNIPQTYCRRMVGLTDAKAAKKMLQEMAISVLNELKDLPAKVTDPHWLDEFAADESK